MLEPRRRSARSRKPQAHEEPQPQPVESSSTTASGANGEPPEEIDVEHAMTNPKSKLTRVDLSVSVMTPFLSIIGARLTEEKRVGRDVHF